MTAKLEKQKADIQRAVEELAEDFPTSPTAIDFIFNTLTDYLNRNLSIFGAAFAFSPKVLNASPFVFRSETGLEQKDIASKIDYTTAIWYEVPVTLRKAVWSPPYFDIDGAGEDILLTAYSIPIFNQQDFSLIGVLTSNLQLARLEEPAPRLRFTRIRCNQCRFNSQQKASLF